MFIKLSIIDILQFKLEVTAIKRVECIPMQKLTYGFAEIHVIEKIMTSQKLYDIITF